MRLKTIEEVGELYFIYSVYNMADILYFSVLMMKAGLEINKLDLILKASFMRLSKESSRIQMLSSNDMIYRRRQTNQDGEEVIQILQKMKMRQINPSLAGSDKGKVEVFQDQKTLRVYRNLKKFEPINSEVKVKLEFFDEQMEQTIEQLDYKIENEQMTAFFQNLNEELV